MTPFLSESCNCGNSNRIEHHLLIGFVPGKHVNLYKSNQREDKFV